MPSINYPADPLPPAFLLVPLRAYSIPPPPPPPQGALLTCRRNGKGNNPAKGETLFDISPWI